jgi:hypothetical protein
LRRPEPERFTLLAPRERDVARKEGRDRHFARLRAGKDCVDEVRCEEGQRQDAPHVAAGASLLRSDVVERVRFVFQQGRPQPDDPARALACAAAMIEDIARWNEERRAKGETTVALGIGVHYGEVLVGNIGDARRLEFTVLGDTVNVASRLERLTRQTGTPLIVSEPLVIAVRGCGGSPSAPTRPAPCAGSASRWRSGASKR